MKTDNLITLHDVMKMTAMSKTTIYKLIQRGEFPKNIRIQGTSSSRWSNNAVNEWVQKQLEGAA